MKKKLKWAGLLSLSLVLLSACGTGPVTSESTGQWEQLIYWFGRIIQFLSINGQIGVGIILFTDVKMSASFIPIFIQLPILMALFQALTRVEALKVGQFLWLNLGEKDPYYILPILAALFTYLSMWLTSKAALEKNMVTTVMSYLMPLMIFWFAVNAASGVALYWVVSNAFQVFQTLLLNNPFKIVAERQAKIEAEKELKAKIRRAQKKARKRK